MTPEPEWGECPFCGGTPEYYTTMSGDASIIHWTTECSNCSTRQEGMKHYGCMEDDPRGGRRKVTAAMAEERCRVAAKKAWQRRPERTATVHHLRVVR